jgi:hypothetical protein
MYGMDSTLYEIIRCILKLLSDYYPTDKQALVVNLRPSCSVAKSDPVCGICSLAFTHTFILTRAKAYIAKRLSSLRRVSPARPNSLPHAVPKLPHVLSFEIGIYFKPAGSHYVARFLIPILLVRDSRIA